MFVIKDILEYQPEKEKTLAGRDNHMMVSSLLVCFQ